MPYLVMSGLLWGTGGLTGTLLAQAAGLPGLSVAAYRLVTLLTIGSTPVIVLAAETAAGRRRPGRGAAATTALALAGLGLLVGLPGGGDPQTAVLASAGLAVTFGAGFAAMTLISARPVAGLDDLAATGFGFTLGGLVLIPLAAVAGRLGFTPHPASIGLLIALGTGPTAVAYTLYFRGLRTAPPSAAALLSLLEPLTGTILAVALLGNRLGGAGMAGAGLLGVAVLATVRAGARPAAGSDHVLADHGLADHGGGPVETADRIERRPPVRGCSRCPRRGAVIAGRGGCTAVPLNRPVPKADDGSCG